MQLLMSGDPTTLAYWLNWRVYLCALWVIGSMVIGIYLIWKYERSYSSESEGGMSSYDTAWKPCLKGIHPVFLLLYRIVAFCLLFGALSLDVVAQGFELYYYYTQWTFTLVTFYFAVGILFSIHGCVQQHKINSNNGLPKDMEKGLYTALAPGVDEKGEKLIERLDQAGKFDFLSNPNFWGDVFQVLFQLTAGAVALTDIVYWCVMFPFLSIKDYQMNILTVLAHSLNVVLLFGDTALNSMQFPFFRISYFLLFTGIYVLFQWILHSAVHIWWPYPFLELSAEYSQYWYLMVALLHLPTYGIFVLAVKAKHKLCCRLFPNSYCYAREIVS